MTRFSTKIGQQTNSNKPATAKNSLTAKRMKELHEIQDVEKNYHISSLKKSCTQLKTD